MLNLLKNKLRNLQSSSLEQFKLKNLLKISKINNFVKHCNQKKQYFKHWLKTHNVHFMLAHFFFAQLWILLLLEAKSLYYSVILFLICLIIMKTAPNLVNNYQQNFWKTKLPLYYQKIYFFLAYISLPLLGLFLIAPVLFYFILRCCYTINVETITILLLGFFGSIFIGFSYFLLDGAGPLSNFFSKEMQLPGYLFSFFERTKRLHTLEKLHKYYSSRNYEEICRYALYVAVVTGIIIVADSGIYFCDRIVDIYIKIKLEQRAQEIHRVQLEKLKIELFTLKFWYEKLTAEIDAQFKVNTVKKTKKKTRKSLKKKKEWWFWKPPKPPGQS